MHHSSFIINHSPVLMDRLSLIVHPSPGIVYHLSFIIHPSSIFVHHSSWVETDLLGTCTGDSMLVWYIHRRTTTRQSTSTVEQETEPWYVVVICLVYILCWAQRRRQGSFCRLAASCFSTKSSPGILYVLNSV
jgi:hypothetical protein